MTAPQNAEIRAEYFKVRLEHTIKHTVEQSRLIYLINGALIALAGFIVSSAAVTQKQVPVTLVLLLLIALNILHALFIWIQGAWYHALDEAYAQTLGIGPIRRREGPSWISSHAVYAAIHIAVVSALVAAVIWLLCGQPLT